MTTKFTFGSWNLNNRSLQSGHVELLRTVDCDLLALQEASEGFHSELSKLNLFDWSVSSLTIRPPGVAEGRARRHGCSIFGRRPFQLDSSSVLTKLHLPERALVAHAHSDSTPLTVCSFHIPPGATWGVIKPLTMKAIAEWLALQPGSLVVGMDANSPKTDHPDPLKNEWWWKDEPALLGSTPMHGLRDAFHAYSSATAKRSFRGHQNQPRPAGAASDLVSTRQWSQEYTLPLRRHPCLARCRGQQRRVPSFK